MTDDDYANVEDFPLINAEQPEPGSQEAGWGRGINIVVRVWSSSSSQTRPRLLSIEASLSSTFSRNIEHPATGHWVTAHARVASC